LSRLERISPRVAPFSIGVSAWLLACGTERVELGPGQTSAPAGAVAVIEVPSNSRGSISEPYSPDVPTYEVLDSPASLYESRPRPLPLFSSELTAPNSGAANGCAKADFLFVVDSSLSMRDRQITLAQSFPGFIRVAEKTLGSSDIHIMVVDTDGRAPSELLRRDAVADDALCEKMRGAGIRSSEQGDSCNIAGDQRFIVQGQPELEQTFACAAQVGTDGSDFEHPIDAMLDALSPTLNQPGGCNAGFLRDDAILFVTLISDEDDRRSDGDPADWQTELLARKGNNSDAVLLLGILADGNLSDGVCRGNQDAPRLQGLANSLGLVGSVCADDYSAFFQQALGWLAARCAARL
jgi:hypothetical protein